MKFSVDEKIRTVQYRRDDHDDCVAVGLLLCQPKRRRQAATKEESSENGNITKPCMVEHLLTLSSYSSSSPTMARCVFLCGWPGSKQVYGAASC